MEITRVTHPVPIAGVAAVLVGLLIAAGCTSKPETATQRSGGDHGTVPGSEAVRAEPAPEPPIAEVSIAPAPAPVAPDEQANRTMAPANVEDITVTARKSAESLQGVPLAVQSFGAFCCPPPPAAFMDQDREQYEHFDANPLKLAREEPVSTFSIDVDTGSYSNVRRFLNAGTLPPQDAVRVEELINYFSYDYPGPASRERPFAVNTAVAPAPWNPDKVLLQIGIKGYEIPAARRAPANLVFLIDVSGSMQPEDKLPLLKRSLRLLARQLRPNDRLSMVVYAGAAGMVLAPTAGDRQGEILTALDRLEAGGSTNGADGIRLAYGLARQAFIKGGINRVLLATDGDFNVGTVDFDALVDLVERERDGGVSLTTLGFGEGNYNEHLLERLADAGNGNYAYIDGLNEGRKVLVEQVTGTLQTIAKDVKIQVEFNPQVVAEYRLIGYENRGLRREDFNNDHIDAGEIGAGHTVTALYELTLAGSRAALVDSLRYGREESARTAGDGDELAFVRLRYKAPDGDTSRLIEQAVRRADLRPGENAPRELRFAAAVAAFGQLLRGGDYTGDFDYEGVAKLAAGARGEDPQGYRSEFLSLVRLAGTFAAETGNGPAGGADDPEAPQARR